MMHCLLYVCVFISAIIADQHFPHFKTTQHMKLLLAIAAFGLLAFTSCSKDDNSRTHDCLDVKISAFQKHGLICDTTASVKEYLFQNRAVFVFDFGTCGADYTSDVLEGNCKLLGRLGGFAGNGKIDGADFSTATYVRTVWEN